jgi:hypothetical protein
VKSEQMKCKDIDQVGRWAVHGVSTGWCVPALVLCKDIDQVGQRPQPLTPPQGQQKAFSVV